MIKLGGLSALAATLTLVPALAAAVLPAGTYIEVRLSVATGSRVSHPGDRIEALIVAPSFHQNRLVLPPGATISGAVASVDRLGLGFKHRAASLEYSFDSIRLPDGRTFPVKTRVRQVETARERVSESGIVSGISPTASLSSGTSLIISALVVDPAVAIPVLGVKFLIARSPDAEIYFPAGTELILELATDAALPDPIVAPLTIPSLRHEEISKMQHRLDRLPRLQTGAGGDRPSDLVNIVLLGTRDQIERAFQAAGWEGEQRHSILALYRMFHCAVQRTGYSMAPMTRLTLNGMVPDAMFQKSLDTFSKRHHIRLWRQPESDIWLGAATEDIAYVVRRMRVTHASDPEIDNERAKIVNDLSFVGCVEAGSLIDRDAAKTDAEEGLTIASDGSIAALRLNDCRTIHPDPSRFETTGQPPLNRIAQALLAVGNDVARSNPVSLGYNVARSFWAFSNLTRQKHRSTQDPGQQEARFFQMRAQRWQRSSVIDVGFETPFDPSDRSAALNAASAFTPEIRPVSTSH